MYTHTSTYAVCKASLCTTYPSTCCSINFCGIALSGFCVSRLRASVVFAGSGFTVLGGSGLAWYSASFEVLVVP